MASTIRDLGKVVLPPLVKKAPAPTATPLPSPALGGAIGCDFRSALSQLLFVEFNGKLSRMDLFPPATLVSSGTIVLKGTFLFDLDTGVEGGSSPNADIWWEQMTNVARQMVPQNGATIINLGAVDFASLSAAALQKLPYGTAPIPGNNDPTNRLVNGDVFAVHTTAGNYAKVKVVTYGYDMTIEWATYQLGAMYAVLGTGYQQPEDVKASADGVHAYVTERTGNLLRVTLASANRAAATVVASGMTAPQQLFLDEAADAAYTVEYAPSGRLWRIDLTTGTKTALLSGITNAVGLVLSADRQFAYVSEQTTGPDQGRVSRYQLSNGQRQSVATGLTAPFFLTWADAGQTALFVPERDPANSLRSINVSTGTAQVAATGLAFRPSSVAVVGPGRLLVCCDQVIEDLLLAASGMQPTGPLLQSIGFIPFDWITPGGLGDTSIDPSYFYQVSQAPFGGLLPVMVNFLRAGLDGASFYRVKVGGNVRTDQFHSARWDGTKYAPATFGPQLLNGQPGYYPVLSIAELTLWIQGVPGCYLDSTNLTSSQTHTITIDFVDVNGNPVESATPLSIYVDNNPCAAGISMPVLNGVSATNDCGFLQYQGVTKATDQVSIAFTASQPEGFATYSFSLIKGVNAVALPQATSGPVSSVVSPVGDTVAALLGPCTVAGFAASVYVAAKANSGWARQSQYDRSAAVAFVLAP